MSEDTFFDSEVVTQAISDIVELQNKVMVFAQHGEFATIREQKENLKTLRELMQKQKNMCFRCTLTDSADAKNLLQEVLNHFVAYGHTVDFDNPLDVFGEVQDNLDDIEFELDFFEKFGRYPDDEDGGTPPTMF